MRGNIGKKGSSRSNNLAGGPNRTKKLRRYTKVKKVQKIKESEKGKKGKEGFRVSSVRTAGLCRIK